MLAHIRIFHLPQHLPAGSAKSLADATEKLDRWRVNVSLQLAEILPADARICSDLLLCQARFQPNSPQLFPEHAARLRLDSG